MKAPPLYIEDNVRLSIKNAVRSHINRRDSLLIIGEYGSGKSSLLKNIKTSKILDINPLGGTYQVLARMAKQYDPCPMHKSKYLEMIISHKPTIFIDEAGLLPKDIFPYLKMAMDNGVSIVMAGLQDFYDNLKTRHPDIASRMTLVKMYPLGYEDMKKLVPDFEEDAFDVLHGGAPNMRQLMQVVKNCRDRITVENHDKVTVELVLEFLPLD